MLLPEPGILSFGGFWELRDGSRSSQDMQSIPTYRPQGRKAVVQGDRGLLGEEHERTSVKESKRALLPSCFSPACLWLFEGNDL